MQKALRWGWTSWKAAEPRARGSLGTECCFYSSPAALPRDEDNLPELETHLPGPSNGVSLPGLLPEWRSQSAWHTHSKYSVMHMNENISVLKSFCAYTYNIFSQIYCEHLKGMSILCVPLCFWYAPLIHPSPLARCWLGTQGTKPVTSDDCMTVQLTGHPTAPSRLSALLPAVPSSPP